MYQIVFSEKASHIDDYENGELDGGTYFGFTEVITGNTPQECIQKACDRLDTTTEAFDPECMGDYENGALSLCTLENANGDTITATDKEFKLWQKGKCTLYACYYYATMYELKTVDISKVKGITL